MRNYTVTKAICQGFFVFFVSLFFILREMVGANPAKRRFATPSVGFAASSLGEGALRWVRFRKQV